MPYHTIPNELIDAGMEATTSAGADVSMIGQLAPVFAFIIVFVLAFALIKKSKILGEHVIFDLLISFIIAIVFASVTGVREIVLSVIPWFAVLLIALFFVLILTTFACADDVPKKFLVWLFLILMIVVFLIAGIKVFAGTVGSYVPGPYYGFDADPQLLFFFDWLWSPGIIGAIWLIVAAVVVSWILIKYGNGKD